MSRFTITQLPLPGLYAADRRKVGDSRGFLARIFCAEDLSAGGWVKPIAQINHTFTAHRGTVRGMHFQRPPHAEMKLVTCLRGEVWDVALDLRSGSPTFLQWHAERLSPENGRAMVIPEGFAHGFQTLTDDAELLYCHSEPYVAAAEAGVSPTDVMYSIRWPLPITELSARDAGHPLLTTEFAGVVV